MEADNLSWLDNDFLQHALEKENHDQVKVIRFTSASAVPPGNNYLSFVYRVQVIYQLKTSPKEHSISLIVKRPIETGFVDQLSKSSNFLDKEPLMYGILLPKMYKKLNIEFGPKSLQSPIKNTVIMKDLKEGGYVLCKSDKQLDYSHCEKVFQTAAKFHAASVSCYHEDPEFVAEKVGVDKMWQGEIVEQWVKNSVENMAKTLQEVDVDEKFQSIFSSKADDLWKSEKTYLKPKLEGLNVLNHGDLWMANMLFKHDDLKNVVDVNLVDFQVTRFASPVLDLIYFIWTSANEDVRKRQKDLYLIYLQTLNDTLEQLGCVERYTLEELRKDLETCKDWALLIVCTMFPFMLTPPEYTVDTSSFTEDDYTSDKFKNIYKGKRFRALLPKVTTQFTAFFANNKGILI